MMINWTLFKGVFIGAFTSIVVLRHMHAKELRKYHEMVIEFDDDLRKLQVKFREQEERQANLIKLIKEEKNK